MGLMAKKRNKRSGGGASDTTEPAIGSSTGTDVSLRDYFFALRKADDLASERLRQSDRRFSAERDRRYSEVAAEREKALAIKDRADRDAKKLERSTQTYKDEQANKLREQINSERGLYATKDEVTAAIREITGLIKPLSDYITGQQGRAGGIGASTGAIVTIILALSAVIGTIVVLVNILTSKGG
jgi:hypothetical protein